MMKAFLIFAICVVAVSAGVTSQDESDFQDLNRFLGNASPKVVRAARRCLKNYKIDNDMNTPITDQKKLEDLTKIVEEHQYCILYCSYYGKGEVKDGTLDTDKLSVGLKPDEKVKLVNMVSQCRAEHPENNCQFMKCVIEKDLYS